MHSFSPIFSDDHGEWLSCVPQIWNYFIDTLKGILWRIQVVIESNEYSSKHYNFLQKQALILREALQYALSYYLFVCTLIGIVFVGRFNLTLGHWTGFLMSYLGIPIVDLFLGMDHRNPPPQFAKDLSNHIIFPLILLLYVPTQTIFLTYVINHFVTSYDQLSLLSMIGLFLSVGMTSGGMGINIGHELFHKINSPIEKYCGIFLLFQANYGHFYIEHVWGHHKHVGTPEDPAASYRGQTIYNYVPRSLIGGFLHAWKIEKNRLKKMNRSFFSVYNRMNFIMLCQILLGYTVFSFFGWKGLLMFYCQSLAATCMVETVNYIEHYGLMRRKTEDGQYEPVSIMHSWNAPPWASNGIFIRLQRHSDHHAFPLKRYQTLCSYEVSPQLPCGYPGLMLLSYFPPIFFRIMNPILDRHMKEQASAPKSKTQIDTRGRPIRESTLRRRTQIST